MQKTAKIKISIRIVTIERYYPYHLNAVSIDNPYGIQRNLVFYPLANQLAQNRLQQDLQTGLRMQAKHIKVNMA